MHTICSCEEYRFGDRQTCEVCNKDRSHGTKYYTIPIGPRLQQLKEVTTLAKVTTLLDTIPQKSRFVSDLHQSSSWNAFVTEMGSKAIALSYCSDGFNPFHHIITQGTYSIWAQTGLILNLPAHMRVKTGTTLLLGLISGPRAPKKLNLYNEILVNELVKLKDGLQVYNAASKQLEMTRVGLLYMVGDVPGIAKEQNRVQQNALNSCSHCIMQGQHSKILDKTVYPGGRMFLHPDDALRQDTTFPSGLVEEENVTLRSSNVEISDARYLDLLKHEGQNEGKKTQTLSTAITQHTGRYGSNHWFRLGLDLQQKNAPVEPMHAIKVVAEHIIKLINGDEDNVKVRAAERACGRSTQLCPDAVYRIYAQEKKTIGQKRSRKEQTSSEDVVETKFPKNQLPQAPYVLTPTEKHQADQRLNQLRVPLNFGVVPTTLFTKIVGGTKSHTWLQLFTTGMVRFCIRDMLGEPQRASLVNFLCLLEEAYGSTVDMDKFEDFEKRWHQGLCMLERDFPVSLQTFYFHLLHHLPQYIRMYGPPKNFWMFPYERFNHTLTAAISNNQHPEVSAVKKMEVQWLLSMLEHSGFLEPLKKAVKCVESSLYPGRHNPVTRHASPEELLGIHAYFKERPVSPLITTFHHARTPKGSYRDTSIESETQKERGSMVLYNNCVGSISLFFSCSGEDLAFISWFGYLDYDTGSRCYFVKNSRNFPNCVLPVKDVSAPLLYAEENGVIWIPKLPDL